jgi:outer membrane protein assembly factor BamC
MEVLTQRTLRIVACAGLAAGLAACGSFSLFPSRKADYQSTASVPSLEVPPDLTLPAFDERFRDRPGSATASGLAASNQPARTGVLPGNDTARVERAGTQRWLVVQGTPDAVWNMARDFWIANGFTMALERPDIGIMETDWAENKALLPQNWLRRQLGRVIDMVYDTGERDRFRTRIERGAVPGTVEVFVSNRGMIEVPTMKGQNAAGGQDFQWKMRESNPELEAEMLQRLLVRLGTPETTAVAAVTKAPEVSLAKVEKAADGMPMLAFDDPFDRAWRRVGLALDRVGFTVVDRDRQKGMYFVRYVDADGSPSSKKDESWLSKLAFWKSEDTSRFQEQYRIVVSEQAGKSQVSVQDKNGAPDKSQTAEKMLSLLLNQLK